MDFFQRLGNWAIGKGWINDEEKRRKEQQQAAPQPQPAPQPVRPQSVQQGGRWRAAGRGQQPSAALQERRRVLDGNAVYRQNLMNQARNEINTAINDPTGYYKQDADQLREEIGKGKAANENRIQGLLQSVQNRRKEISEGRAPTQPVPQPEKKPGFFDYLNPFGEHGLFGAKQQKLVRDTIEKPIVGTMKSYENWVDSSDDEQGFQWTNPADYLRFAAKLPSGMVTGAVEAPRKAGEAISGVRVKDDDSIEQLSGLQRAGAGADAAISLGGLGYGGSGTLIKSAFGQGVKEVAKQGGRQAFIQGAKSLAKDAAKEGVEEVAQAFVQDLSDDGKVNTPIDQYVQSGLQGALGGGMMHAGGKATQASRRAFNSYRQGKLSSPEAVESTIPQASPALKQAVSKDVAAIEQGNTGLLNYRRKTSGKLENFLVQEATEYHIAQNTDTRYKLNPEQVAEIRAYNDHIGLLRQQESKLLAQGLSENSAPVINNRKAQAEAIYARDHIGEMSPEGVRYKHTREDVDDFIHLYSNKHASTPQHDRLGPRQLRTLWEVLDGTNSDKLRIADEINPRAFWEYRRDSSGNETRIPRTAEEYRRLADEAVAYRNSPEYARRLEEGRLKEERYQKELKEYARANEQHELYVSKLAAELGITKEAVAKLEDGSRHRERNMFNDRAMSQSYNRMRNGGYNAEYMLSNRAIDAMRNGRFPAEEAAKRLGLKPETIERFLPTSEWHHVGKDATPTDFYDINDLIHASDNMLADTVDSADPSVLLLKKMLAHEEGMRYRQQSPIGREILRTDALARHLKVTGDERLVFNEWRNEMEKNALGYYDPKTDKINLNQLTEDTLNHELGHKLLRRTENNAELIAHIRQEIGDDALIARYGKGYGTDDLNLLAEEYLADGFSDYSKGILNGEDKVRLATRLNIPPRIIAAYDRIIEAIKGLVGKQDQIRQFYAQVETGKFRNSPQVADGDMRVREMSLDASKALETIKKFDDVLRGIRRITKLDTISDDVAARITQATGIDVRGGASIELTNQNAIHIHNRHIKNPDDPRPLGDYDIAALPEVIKDPDTIVVEKVVRGAQRIKFEREMEGNKKAVVEVIKKGNALNVVTYFNDSSSGRPNAAEATSGYTLETGQLQSTNPDDIVANPPRIVNDKRFKINDTAQLSEAGQDARNFYFEEYKDKGADAMRRDLIEQIWKENKKGQGVDFIQTPGEYYGGKRVSNNNPFYAGFYEEYGRKPTKQEITAIVDDALGVENELGRVSLPRAAEDYLIGNYFGDIDGLRTAYSQVDAHANTPAVRPAANKLDNAARQEASEALQQEYETHLDHQWAARLDEKHKQEILKQRKAFDRQQQIKELVKRAYEQGPSRKLVDIADAVKSVTKAKKGEVEAIMQQVADDMNLDITGERAFVKNTSKVPSLVDPTTGEVTPIDQLILDEAVRKQMKPGVEHAIPASTERSGLKDNVQQMIYRNEDGTYGAYYEYRKADGTWHKPGAVPVTSALQTNLMSKITDDATINKEVKRAYEDGINIQYIWRESSDGANSELVKKFEEIVDKALTVVGKGKKKSPPGEVLSFDPNIHYIHKGKVVDGRTGQVMGNYVEITAKGDVIMYAGKKKIHLRQNDLDFDAFKQLWSSGATWTTEGQIDRMTGALDWPWSRNKDRSNSIEYFMEGKKNANKETLTEIMVELPRRMQAAMLQEGEALGSMVDEHAKKLRRTLPLRGRKQALQEAVYVIEPARPKRGEKAPTFEQRLESFRQVYGDRAAKQLAEYNAFLRATYKNLLMRVNEKRLELGMEPIHERADYLTHTSEIHSAGQTIFDNISSLAAGDIMDKGRGGLPAKLVGLTGSFKPNMKFNQFAQARYGDTKPTDPFTPLKEYAKVALHNIHMTDAITMNRSLETAFRAASEARSEVAQMGPIGVETLANKVDDFAQNIRGNEIDIDEATTVLKKIYGLERGLRTKINGFTEFKRAINKARRASEGKETAVLADEDLAVLKSATERMVSSLVETSEDIVKFQELTKTADSLGKATYFVREHANRLAGKTDAMERAAKDEAGVLDRAGNMAIRGMQKQAALSKIVGNFSSVVAQAFSLPDLAATTSPTALGKALKSMWDPKVQQASAAVASRYAKDTLSRRSTFDKTMGIAGKPMEVFERTIIQYSFAAKYEHGISKGLSHADSVRYAERFIGDTVTYRDAVSTPRAYKRKLPSLLLQFQREVVQQGRYKLRYITPKRAAVALALYAVMTQAYEAMTGSKPGGDVVGALVATALDFAGAGDEEREEEEKTVGARIGRGIGRMTGEVVAMAPLVGSPINTFIDKETRKNIFGTENNLGRYAGGLAAVSQIQSAGNAISYWHKADKAAAEGDDDKATALRERSILSAMKELPAGSQLRKSTQGVFAMSRGHTLDSHGEVKAEVDKNNPLKWVQAVAFGENALSEQQRANKTDNWFLRGGDSSASTAVGGVRPGLDLLDKKERLKIQKKLKSGEWREENGLMLDKQGDVQRTYHKALAQTQGESDEAYANWMKAYDIDNAGSKPRRSSGNAMLDRLQAEKDKTNSAETAVRLVTDTEKYRDLPQWVKDRYYEKSGYKKHEIEYAALASYGPSEKLHAYWLPRAKELSHEQLLQELTNGRRESIAGDILAPNGVVDNLALHGLISKDEARALRRTNFTHDGTPKASGRGGGGSGSGRGRSSSLAAIHEAFSRSVQLSKNARAHRPATTTSATGRVAMKQAQLRKWSPGRRATSTIRSRRSA